MKPEINFDDFQKLDLRVAQVKNVEEVEGADKLYKLTLDVGEEIGERVVCAGIKEFYSKEDLEDKKIILIANLAPRKLRSIESQGMILAADDDGKPVFLTPESDAKVGSVIR